jgi:uncharacterized protein YwqG
MHRITEAGEIAMLIEYINSHHRDWLSSLNNVIEHRKDLYSFNRLFDADFESVDDLLGQYAQFAVNTFSDEYNPIAMQSLLHSTYMKLRRHHNYTTHLSELLANPDDRVSFWALYHSCYADDANFGDLINAARMRFEKNAVLLYNLHILEELVSDNYLYIFTDYRDREVNDISHPEKNDVVSILEEIMHSNLSSARKTQIGNAVQDSLQLSATPIDDHRMPVGSSKIGGCPDLPNSIMWPVYDGLPMSFLAQINLSEIRGSYSDLLPERGVLSFFSASGCTTEEGYVSTATSNLFAVYYHDEPILQRHALPIGILEETYITPCTITFQSQTTLPHEDTIFVPSERRSNEIEIYSKYFDKYSDLYSNKSIQMFGHPNPLHDHPFSRVCEGDLPVEITRLEDEYVLLLQFCPSEGIAPMYWCNYLYFYIRRDDLHAKNFKGVISIRITRM